MKLGKIQALKQERGKNVDANFYVVHDFVLRKTNFAAKKKFI